MELAFRTAGAIVLSAILLGGCANLSTLQTARTVPKGQLRFVFGAGWYDSAPLDRLLEKSGLDAYEDLSYPVFDLSVRGGIAKKVDFGGKASLLGGMGGDLKYQLLDFEVLAAAVGLGLSYQYVPLKRIADGVKDAFHMIDLSFPLYLSFDLSTLWTLYGSGKFIVRQFFGEFSGAAHLGMVSAGVKFGEGWGALAEISYFKSLENGIDGRQFNLGLFVDLGV